MTRRHFAILALFSLLTTATNALAVDTAKLRRTVSLPMIGVIIDYGVNRRGDFTNRMAARTPQPEKIAAIEKELKGDATDAERYSRLAELYFGCGQSDKGKEANRKVVSLLRKQLEQHPGDFARQLRLADALEDIKEWEEAETLARRAERTC